MSDALAVEYNAEFRQAIELALRVALQKTQEDIEDGVEVPEPLLAIMGETYILLNHIDAQTEEIKRLRKRVEAADWMAEAISAARVENTDWPTFNALLTAMNAYHATASTEATRTDDQP